MSLVPTDKLIVLTGGDRVGKSTLLANIAVACPDWEVGSFAPQDWLPQPELPHLDWALTRHPRSFIHELTPLARATTLLNYIMCFYEYWMKPRLMDGKVVIVDSYYYRFYIKERLKNIVPAFFYDALDLLPDAHMAVIAELSPHIAYNRRSESCAHEVYDRHTEEGFIHFQSDVASSLSEFCNERCEITRVIDASLSPEALTGEFISLVNNELERKTLSGTEQ